MGQLIKKDQAIENYNSLQNLTEESIELLVGIPELVKVSYNENESKAIKLELVSYAKVKNEQISIETLNAWINEFECLQMKAFEVIKRIRLAKHEKKFGNTDFSVFMNVDIENYYEFYKHKKQ